jgi:hypothetical protein
MYYVEQCNKLKDKGYRVDTMPSGLTCFVYITETNLAHPYIRYSSNEITIHQVYDMAIGYFGVITND